VLAPNRFEGYFLLGQAALRTRDHDSAVKLFARAVELAPDRDEPQLALGMTHELRGEYAAAYRAFAAVAERNPGDLRVRGLLTNVSDSLDD
jgi:cytochrome c-type biogenesis protein CcmH/NrfG